MEAGFHVQTKVSLFLLAPASPGHRSAALRWVAHLGLPGLFAVAALDASIIPLAIPGSTDLLLLWIIAHGGTPWVMVSCAVAGSVLGGYTTWHLGKKGGEAALDRYVSPRLLKRIRGWVKGHNMLAVFLPAILPPPIPLWPFLLAAGALGSTFKRFLAAFGAGRAVRYAFVGWLAVRYGRPVIRLWSRTLDQWSIPLLWTFGIVSVASLAYGIYKLRRPHGGVPATSASPVASEQGG